LRTFFGKRRIDPEVDTLAVEFLVARRDPDSVRIDPRTPTDPISRMDCGRIA
jgi:hypothetical protein